MSLSKGLMMLAASVAIVATTPCQAAAKVVVAYLLFDISGSDVAEKLKSTSLGNCKQLLVGQVSSNEQILHLACDERDGESHVTYLSQAVVQLAQIEGVERATVLLIRTGSQ